MSLPFSALYELWETLGVWNAQDRDGIVRLWFEEHAQYIRHRGPSALALLSCLFPEKRADRVYGLREKKLTRLVMDVWGVGSSRRKEFQRVQLEGRPDFALAVQRLVEEGGDSPGSPTPLMVEEVDQTLDMVASTCDFSSPSVRNKGREYPVDPITELKATFRRLNALGLKWMIRLLLKDLRPAIYSETFTMGLFHKSLPRALEVRGSLVAAVELLPQIAPGEKPLHCRSTMSPQPQVGTIVGLPTFDKARGINHCRQLVGSQEISVERKYDGEYCQVHVHVDQRGQHDITLFSKSGRESTKDREPTLSTIADCLQLNTADRRVRRQCILVGELLVWSDLTREIMPFFVIRRYVTRAGRHLGCDRDSPPSPHEHLMIVFYDLLLLDDTYCIDEAYEDRRIRLQTLVQPKPGRAEVGQRVIVDFRRSQAAGKLALHFACAISRNWEGLVLKGLRDPYVNRQGTQRHIKLKKDYIPGLGDSADLAVVGGRYEANGVLALGSGTWWWTNFFLACVENKADALAQNTRPSFRIVGEVSRPSICIEDVRTLNQWGRLYHVPLGYCDSEITINTDLGNQSCPTHLFTRPMVVEVVGAGFDRPSNSRYDTLRFPRVMKIYHDRTVGDAVTFAQYQSMAERSREVTASDAELWLRKLGFDHVANDLDGSPMSDIDESTYRRDSRSTVLRKTT